MDKFPIKYRKFEQKTGELGISTDKIPLGKGESGTVYTHKQDPSLAVKKSGYDMSDEFEIGATLDHPSFVKSKALYVKKKADGSSLSKIPLCQERCRVQL
ncbi:MAG: hypothetical protein WCK42_00180 [Myxococcaceae bacterium]